MLGDTLHDGGAMERSTPPTGDTARAPGRDRLAVAHRQSRSRSSAGLGGTVARELAYGGVTLRHEPTPGPAGTPEIAGHLHPAGKVRGGGRSLRRRCFAADARRCVLPAFGAYAGGLNVLDAAFRPLFARGTLHGAHARRRRVYAVPASALAPD